MTKVIPTIFQLACPLGLLYSIVQLKNVEPHTNDVWFYSFCTVWCTLGILLTIRDQIVSAIKNNQ